MSIDNNPSTVHWGRILLKMYKLGNDITHSLLVVCKYINNTYIIVYLHITVLKFIFTWPHLLFIVFLPPKVPWFWRSLWFYHSKMHIFPEVFLRKMNVLTVKGWKVEMTDADNRVKKPWSTDVFGVFVWKHGKTWWSVLSNRLYSVEKWVCYHAFPIPCGVIRFSSTSNDKNT